MIKYSKKFKYPRWQRKRLEVIQRDHWKCRICGENETTLYVHYLEHTKPDPWDEPIDNLITLCEDCYRIAIVIEKIKNDALNSL